MSMQSIINEYNSFLAGDDLFVIWQKENQLRQQIREASAGENVHIESPEEFDFLHRALYLGPRRETFFSILYDNISSHSILKRVREALQT